MLCCCVPATQLARQQTRYPQVQGTIDAFCSRLREQAGPLGDVLVAARLGRPEAGAAGLLVAASAGQWHVATAAVQRIVNHLRQMRPDG